MKVTVASSIVTFHYSKQQTHVVKQYKNYIVPLTVSKIV